MKKADLQKSVALVDQHAYVLARMGAIFATANAGNRELRGEELLKFDRLRSEAEGILADLRKIDALAARAASADMSKLGVKPKPSTAPATLVAPPPQRAGAPVPANDHNPQQPLTQSSRFARDLQSGIQHGLGRGVQGAAHAPKIRGYGALFNTLSRPINLSGRRFMVLPGAFDFTGGAIPLCRDHDISRSYASTEDGTLRAWQDNQGLAIEATLQKSPSGNSLLSAVHAGSHRGMSILWRNRKSTVETVRGEQVEVISKSQIGEVSVVRSPLCPGSNCWIER